MKTTNEPSRRGKGGRNPKNDPAKECVMVRFSSEEYARFLTLFEQSGVKAKAVFIKARVFDMPFKVIKTDRSSMEYVAKLTTFFGQFRHIGVNYNLHTHFSEKKVLVLLYKLEKITKELVAVEYL